MRTRQDSGESANPEIDGYDIIRLLGRGGMGVVYLARQKSVDRLVALKILKPKHVEPLGIEEQQELTDRFYAETLAAARIESDHVVPVYEVVRGESMNYYTMQFIEGHSLFELIGKQATPTQTAKYIAHAAKGIHAAHQQQILHRDIKPHNIMVADATDRGMVMDFGLAKLQNADQQITADRSVIGTIAYMSPEQTLDSSTVTFASDIYGLGASLYHCLTGRPPFRASTLPEVTRQISMDEPVRPSRLNREITGDLEAICLKCLEKKPADRYHSAVEVADDLERFLAGKPTLARPLTRAGTMLRWCKRNNLVASLASLAVLFLVATTVVSTLAYQKISQQNTSLNASLQNERDANDKASRALQKGLESVLDFSLTVSESPVLLQSQPNIENFRRKLLNQSRTYLDEFAAIENVNGIQEKVVRALIDSAGLSRQLGEPEKAEQSLGAARERLDAVEDKAAAEKLAFMVDREAGQLFVSTGNSEKAADYFRQAYDAVELLAANEAGNEFTRELAITGRLYASTLTETGRFDEAQAAFEPCIEAARKLYDETGEDRDAIILAVALNHSGTAKNRVKHPSGLGDWREAVDVFEKTDLSKLPHSAIVQYASALMHMAMALKETDKEAALQFRIRSVSVFEELARMNPNVGRYECGYIKACNNLVFDYQSRKQFDKAEEILDEIEPRVTLLMARTPTYLQYKHTYALVLEKKLINQYETGKTDLAYAACVRHKEVCRELTVADRTNRSYQSSLSHSMRNLTELKIERLELVPAFKLANEVYERTFDNHDFRNSTYGQFRNLYTKVIAGREAKTLSDADWVKCREFAAVHVDQFKDSGTKAAGHWFFAECWRIEDDVAQQLSELKLALKLAESEEAKERYRKAIESLATE